MPGHVVGVGPVVAAGRAAVLIERIQPEGVVLIGTAGRYPGGPSIGSVIRASPLGLGDGAARAGLGYVPVPPEPILPGSWFDGDSLAARVLTLPAITTDPTVAHAFASDGWEAEHMETYAVGWACREAGVPFAALLGVTNDVGPTAHEQWIANREAVQDAVRTKLLDLISSLGHILSAADPGVR